MKRYVVFVAEPFSTRLLTAFRQWRERIEFIVTPTLANKPSFKGIAVYKPEELTPEILGDAPIVFLDGDESVFDKQLSEVLVQRKTRFLTRRQWVVEMLEDRTVQLAPDYVRLDICTRCQLNCASCYMRVDKKETTGIGHVELSLFDAFLERNPFIRRVEISNSGEPFLHPQMHEIVEIARKHGVLLECINGANFNNVSDQVLEDIATGCFEVIYISIDGASQETYSIYRRNGSFDKVVANIRKLNEIKRRNHSQLPTLVWQFVVMSHNYDDVPRAKKMAEELGMFITFRDTWDLEEKAKLQKLLAERNTERHDDKQGASNIVADNKNTFHYWRRDLLINPQINWDGRLLGCCQIYRSDWGVNVFDQGLVETLNSDVYRETLLALLKAAPLPYRQSPCYTCDMSPKTLEEAEEVVGHYVPHYYNKQH